MSDKRAANLITLSDADIKTTRFERRSFLAMVGLPTAAAAAVLMTSSCGGADSCDTDSTTDADPTDRVGQGQNDRCDNDRS